MHDAVIITQRAVCYAASLRRLTIGLMLLCLFGCGRSGRALPRRTITVAAAANLNDAFDRIGEAFEKTTGIEVTYSYGATAILARQIEHRAPFDAFAGADTEHLDALVAQGFVTPDSRVIYARGQLALWAPFRTVAGISDLLKPEVRFVAIANPTIAPYGQAAAQAFRSLGMWDRVKPKLVYASNISMAKQFAESGNADAAVTAYSLVQHERGTVTLIDRKLHQPLDQAMGLVRNSSNPEAARKFVDFVTGPRGQAILRDSGYLTAQ